MIWRCHVGRDRPNEHTETAWAFLTRYAAHADSFVFSRREYAPAWADRPSSTSSRPPSTRSRPRTPNFPRAKWPRCSPAWDSSTDSDRDDRWASTDVTAPPATSAHTAPGIVLDGRPPPTGVPLVVQVSRWDRLKDMAGVMTGFAEMLRHDLPARPHLMLARTRRHRRHRRPRRRRGTRRVPSASANSSRTASATGSIWPRSPWTTSTRTRLIVNAVQRYADVVVQKSLVEGFGLTVTEAMWKGRPVLASRVGGIQDQIRHERDGLLLDDPTDPVAFARTLRRVLEDYGLAARLGAAARARVLDQYVGDRHLEQYADVLSRLSA